MKTRKSAILALLFLLFAILGGSVPLLSQSGGPARDPGVRAGSVNVGTPLSTLSASQLQFFQDGQARFEQVDTVSSGLGPTFNSNGCASCHSQPAVGGTSPSASQFPNVGQNPQIEAGTANGAANTIPFFITADGPVREARFPFQVTSNG